MPLTGCPHARGGVPARKLPGAAIASRCPHARGGVPLETSADFPTGVKLSPCSWGCSVKFWNYGFMKARCPHARGGVPLYHRLQTSADTVVPMLVGVFRAIITNR